MADAPRPGEPSSLGDAYAAIYDELHEIASRKMRREAVNHTLQPTALVHEAFLRLSTWKHEGPLDATDIRRLAARVMSNFLKDYARGKNTRKRGGDYERVTFNTSVLSEENNVVDILSLAEALDHLESIAPRAAEIVEMRYFGDFKESEIAALLEISESTVRKDWRWARSVLSSQMAEAAG